MVAISIVIPTKNERKNLRRLLKSIKNQTFKDYEVIVVDGGSDDGTVELAKKYGCRVYYDNGKGPAYARNLGAIKAKGKLIYFVDADWWFKEKDHLKIIWKEYKKKEFKCALPISQIKYGSLIGKLIFLEISSSRVINKIQGAYIFEKDAFIKLGMFDSNLGFGEDTDLALKIIEKGYKVYIIKNAILNQAVVDNVKTLFKQGVWYGRSMMYFIKKRKKWKLLLSMLYWLCVPILPMLILFALTNILILLLLLLLFIPLAYYVLKGLLITKDMLFILVPAVKFVRSCGEIIGLIYYLKGSKSRGQ